MKRRLLASLAVAVLALPLSAHRLDEYLQAALLSVGRGHIDITLRLIPGVAVFPVLVKNIDSNGDGVLSADEQRAYAEQVLHDLSLHVDGQLAPLRLRSAAFPDLRALAEGTGEIQLQLSAAIQRTSTARRQLIFENHHLPGLSVYLMNCLVPAELDLQIVAQERNPNQSRYQLDYQQTFSSSAPSNRNLDAFGAMFRLGLRHIAEGTDHLLFLLALLLPAPLMAGGARWTAAVGVRKAITNILRVVTAFTVGHSLTLGLAALGVVHVPSRPIEVLIAVSILVSALHAWRPIFPGREAFIALFFGLIHGLAFASTLQQLGLGWKERVINLLGFNLGIEAMQLLVVAAIIPSFLLLSRTSLYPSLRMGGAAFAGLASLSWIVERVFDVNTGVNVWVNAMAHYAIGIATLLFFVSLGAWRVSEMPARSRFKLPICSEETS